MPVLTTRATFRSSQSRGLAAGLLALGLTLSGAAAQEPAPGPAAAPAPIAVGEDAVPDAAIQARLDGIIAAIPAFGDIRAEVRSGVVSLTGSVAEAADATRLADLAGRLQGVVTVQSEIEATSDVGERLTPAFSRLRLRLREILAALPLALVGLAAFGAITGIGFALSRGWRLYDRIAPNPFIADIYRQVVLVVFVFAGFVVALDLLGATAMLGTILGAAGIVGLAVGFGVRDTIENFVASVMLSVRQPFAPNDLVEIEGTIGHVIRLTSRATVLLSPDGNHVRLPNAMVFKGRIVNYTREPQRRFVFDLGVDPDSDLTAARDTGGAALVRLPFVLDEPRPKAWIENVGDSNVVLRFTGWIDQRRTDFETARGEAIHAAKLALESAGFALPEPVYRLRIDRGGQSPAPAPPAPPASRIDTAVAERDATIERKVEADRRAAPDTDLLRPDGAAD